MAATARYERGLQLYPPVLLLGRAAGDIAAQHQKGGEALFQAEGMVVLEVHEIGVQEARQLLPGFFDLDILQPRVHDGLRLRGEGGPPSPGFRVAGARRLRSALHGRPVHSLRGCSEGGRRPGGRQQPASQGRVRRGSEAGSGWQPGPAIYMTRGWGVALPCPLPRIPGWDIVQVPGLLVRPDS